MKNAYRNRKGFTLVEILIVVIILGILAAIVIPQFTSASEDARKSSMTSQLQTLRSQIELYKLQHRDALPALATDFSQLTGKTNDDGTTTGSPALGPYLQQTPTNPTNGLSTVTAVTSDVTPGSTVASCGFVFNTSNGKIWATDKTKTAVAAE